MRYSIQIVFVKHQRQAVAVFILGMEFPKLIYLVFIFKIHSFLIYLKIICFSVEIVEFHNLGQITT